MLAHTYSNTADPVAALNFSTPTGDKLKGSWVLVLDDSFNTARRDSLKPSSNVCGAHDFAFDASSALYASTKKMAGELFEQVADAKEPPDAAIAARDKLAGALVVKLDDFTPRFTCATGFSALTCNASTEISLSVTLLRFDRSTVRRSFSVNSQRTTDGPGGNLCSNALALVNEATRRAQKDALEHVAERVSTMVQVVPAQ